MAITRVVTGGKGGDSGENGVQQSSAGVLRGRDPPRLRTQDSQLGMCLLPLCGVRFPEMWVLDLMTLEGLGAARMWTRNGVRPPASLETKARLCRRPHAFQLALQPALCRPPVTAAAEPGRCCGSREAAATCVGREVQPNEVEPPCARRHFFYRRQLQDFPVFVLTKDHPGKRFEPQPEAKREVPKGCQQKKLKIGFFSFLK